MVRPGRTVPRDAYDKLSLNIGIFTRINNCALPHVKGLQTTLSSFAVH